MLFIIPVGVAFGIGLLYICYQEYDNDNSEAVLSPLKELVERLRSSDESIGFEDVVYRQWGYKSAHAIIIHESNRPERHKSEIMWLLEQIESGLQAVLPGGSIDYIDYGIPEYTLMRTIYDSGFVIEEDDFTGDILKTPNDLGLNTYQLFVNYRDFLLKDPTATFTFSHIHYKDNGYFITYKDKMIPIGKEYHYIINNNKRALEQYII
jgi:hypothetical protein